jgi:hypothetical protein
MSAADRLTQSEETWHSAGEFTRRPAERLARTSPGSLFEGRHSGQHQVLALGRLGT